MRIGENIRGRGFSGLSSIYLGGRRYRLMLGGLWVASKGVLGEEKRGSGERYPIPKKSFLNENKQCVC